MAAARRYVERAILFGRNQEMTGQASLNDGLDGGINGGMERG
jgi:hypothetical protein